MFKKLFHHPRVISRHANAPLAEERNTFLSHLASRGTPRSTLLRYARQLRVISIMLGPKAGSPITRQEISQCAQRWAQRQRQRGRAQTLKWPRAYFHQVASAWASFMGQLEVASSPPIRDAAELEAWLSFLRSEAQLSERTSRDYGWWIRMFLEWLEQERSPLRRLTARVVDQFIQHLALRGLNRVSLAKATTVLRRFLRYAFEQEWCRRDLSGSILSPRLFRFESLPMGPSWPDVKRLVGATEGSSRHQLRNRAILLLLAVYGLRSGEVRCLCRQDIDWDRRILRVHRTKTGRLQEYPLTAAMSQALRQYLKRGRPASTCPEVFLTLHAPFRPLSAGALCDLVRSLMERLEITGSKRGPHALRHACATYLLNQGLSLKKVSDHLGHQSLSATQIYAKVDLNGLRAVADFDLGGLL
jgi:site-specific recombinase XerD